MERPNTSGPADSQAILILDRRDDSRAETRRCIAGALPSAQIEAVRTVEGMREVMDRCEFDLVVLDHDGPETDPIEILHELRMREHEPSVLVVSASGDPRSVAEVYNHGGQRCIVKEGDWRPQLGSVVRQALRQRKAHDQNRRLHARLVEANMLLEEKNKRLDEFSATVAHDIRGPLSGLTMKLDFILENYRGKLDSRCETLLANGMESVMRLNGMVQSMYDYAKLGAQAAHMEQVDLGMLVNGIVSDAPLGDHRDVQFEFGGLPVVWGNAELLRRVFLNLISNAVKYNDAPNPRIDIAATAVAEGPLAEMCEISVCDNGRGIPRHEREFVLKMFQRGTSAGRDTEGHGIGLAVVQRVVELHYGKIRIEENIPCGSRFIFTLPLRRIDLSR